MRHFDDINVILNIPVQDCLKNWSDAHYVILNLHQNLLNNLCSLVKWLVFIWLFFVLIHFALSEFWIESLKYFPNVYTLDLEK